VAERVVSIVPRLPPAICGVSNFGWLLAQDWPNQDTTFYHLVVDGAAESIKSLHYPFNYDVSLSSSVLTTTLASINPHRVLLHYANRGFHRFGCPFWLSRGISNWRKLSSNPKLTVYFHEVSPRLPLTNHHGIIARCDRHVIRKLSASASYLLTNSQHHSSQLGLITGKNSIDWFPVPSNIPPPAHPACFSERRQKEFLVFGLPNTQQQTISIFRHWLLPWIFNNKLETLHIVGPTSPAVIQKVTQQLGDLLPFFQIVWHGELSPSRISVLLAEVGFCLTNINSESFSKSSTFMAYAAHACPTISCVNHTMSPLASLIHPSQILSCDYSSFQLPSTSLYNWYVEAVVKAPLSQRLSEL